MKKYKVWYKAYDNDAWIHRDGEVIVEANSPEEAKEIVHGYSNFAEEYFATSVQEVKQLTHKRRQLERVAFPSIRRTVLILAFLYHIKKQYR